MTQPGPAPDLLGADPRPPFFPVADPGSIGLTAPADRLGVPIRTWVRALAGMQKESVSIDGSTGQAWRLVSDEGPYLAGHDRAPCPLCTFITGMVSSYTEEIMLAAADAALGLDALAVTAATHYSMEGSALRGTMLGGAQNPELRVDLSADADTADLEALVDRAVRSSPVAGLLHGATSGLFSLTWNGSEVPVGSVDGLDAPLLIDPHDAFDRVVVAETDVAADLMVKVKPAEQVEGVPGGINSSLEESQSRRLHVQARCTVRPDGIKEIQENLFSPIGSEFRFLSSEDGRAPNAATYLSAGIGFCFMTQFGRYASITKKRLDRYTIVQDTHFSRAGSGDGRAAPIETHVHLVTPEGEDFARTTLDMGERTCFLHATCRTDLGLDLSIES